MRVVTYGGAVSLDGFLAGKDGAMDWMHFSKDAQDIMKAYWKDVDTILMGRKTYEVAVAQRGTGAQKSKETQRAAKAPAIRSYVFSRTLKKIDDPNVELVAGDAADFVSKLKQQPGKGICLMGGGELAESLFAVGLIDHVGLNIHPILLGSGIPAFRDPAHRVKLTLTECRQFEGGCILANYEVAHAQ